MACKPTYKGVRYNSIDEIKNKSWDLERILDELEKSVNNTSSLNQEVRQKLNSVQKELQAELKKKSEQEFIKSIFPDTELDFITYHGTKNPIKGGKFRIDENSTGKGLWFTKNKEYAKTNQRSYDIGDKPVIYNVILNSKNPAHFYNSSGAILAQSSTSFFKGEIESYRIGKNKQFNQKINDAAIFHHPHPKRKGKDFYKKKYEQIVVFDANQIHILTEEEQSSIKDQSKIDSLKEQLKTLKQELKDNETKVVEETEGIPKEQKQIILDKYKDKVSEQEFKNSLFRGQEAAPTIDKNGNLVLTPTHDSLFKTEGVSFAEDRNLAEEYGSRYSKTPYIIEINEDFADSIYPLNRKGGTKAYGQRVVGDEREQRFISKDDIIIPIGNYKIHKPTIKINLKNVSTKTILEKYQEQFTETDVAEHLRYGESGKGYATENQKVYIEVEDELLDRGLNKSDLPFLIENPLNGLDYNVAEAYNLTSIFNGVKLIDESKVTPELIESYHKKVKEIKSKLINKGSDKNINYEIKYSLDKNTNNRNRIKKSSPTLLQNEFIENLKSIEPAYADYSNEQVQAFIDSKIPNSKYILIENTDKVEIKGNYGNIILSKNSNIYTVRNVNSSIENQGVATNLYKEAIKYVVKNKGVLKADEASAPQSLTIYKKLEKEELIKINDVSEQWEDGRYVIDVEITGKLPVTNSTILNSPKTIQEFKEFINTIKSDLREDIITSLLAENAVVSERKNTQYSENKTQEQLDVEKQIRDLRDADGSVSSKNMSEFNRLSKLKRFLSLDNNNKIERALNNFQNENNLTPKESKILNLYISLYNNFKGALNAFNEKLNKNLSTNLEMDWIDSNNIAVQDTLKSSETELNNIEDENTKKLLSEIGLEVDKDYTANELNDYINKHGSKQVKFIWNLIKNIAQKLGVTTQFKLQKDYEAGKDSLGFFSDGKIINRASNFKNPENAARVIVHELVHGVTSYIITAVSSNNSKITSLLTQKQINAATKLSNLLKQIKNDPTLKDQYGATNEHELLAELTNSQFVEDLKNKKLNFVEKILDYILDILGVSTNAYSEALSILEDMISSPIDYISLGEKDGNKLYAVDYTLSIIQALDKFINPIQGKRNRKYGEVKGIERETLRLNTKERPNLETNIRKTLNGKEVTNQQIDLLFDYMKQNNLKKISVQDAIEGLKEQYGFVVEINTAKEPVDDYKQTVDEEGNVDITYFEPDTELELELDEDGNVIGTKTVLTKLGKQQIKDREEKRPPTQHYSKLSAPGGTKGKSKYEGNPDWEYQEIEFHTPDITPSIKGHAEFATDNGIGWARVWYNKKTGEVHVQEIQSDLFQKGRDSKDLVQGSIDDKFYIKNSELLNKLKIEVNKNDNPFNTEVTIEGVKYDRGGLEGLWFEVGRKATSKVIKENQFLQLLNKEGNWVNFFIQAIVQDSVKKGYKKVLFPTGETIVKIEQSDVAAEIKKIDEQITEVNSIIIDEIGSKIPNPNFDISISQSGLSPELYYEKDGEYFWHDVDAGHFGEDTEKSISKEVYEKGKSGKLEEGYFKEYPNASDTLIVTKDIRDNQISYKKEKIKELEAQKQNLKTQSLEKLAPIEAFYTNRVTNILNKLYDVKEVTDEYGNTWNEVDLSQKLANNNNIQYQKVSQSGKVLAKYKTHDELGKMFADKTLSPGRISSLKAQIRKVNSENKRKGIQVTYAYNNLGQFGETNDIKWEFVKYPFGLNVYNRLKRDKSKIVDHSQSTTNVSESERLLDETKDGEQLAMFHKIQQSASILLDEKYLELYGKTFNDEFTEVEHTPSESPINERLKQQVEILRERFGVDVVFGEVFDEEGKPASGKIENGVITLNPDYIQKDTVIHEFAHLFIDIVSLDNVRVKAALAKLEGSRLAQEVMEERPELSGAALQKEILATALGRKGNEIFDREFNQTWWTRFVDWFYSLLSSKTKQDRKILETLTKEFLSFNNPTDPRIAKILSKAQFQKWNPYEKQRIVKVDTILKNMSDNLSVKLERWKSKGEDKTKTNYYEKLESIKEELDKYIDTDNVRGVQSILEYTEKQYNTILKKLEKEDLTPALINTIESFSSAFDILEHLGTALRRDKPFKESVHQKEYYNILKTLDDVLRKAGTIKQNIKDISIDITAVRLAKEGGLASAEYKLKAEDEFRKSHTVSEYASKKEFNEALEKYQDKVLKDNKKEIEEKNIIFFENALTNGVDISVMWRFLDSGQVNSQIIQLVQKMLDKEDLITRQSIIYKRQQLKEILDEYRALNENVNQEKMYDKIITKGEKFDYLISEFKPVFTSSGNIITMIRDERWNKLSNKERDIVKKLQEFIKDDDKKLWSSDKLHTIEKGQEVFRLPNINKPLAQRLRENKIGFTLKKSVTELGVVEESDTEFGMQNEKSKKPLSMELLTNEADEKLNRIPVFYRTPIETKDRSRDIFTNLLLNHATSENFKNKNKISADIEIIQSLISEKKEIEMVNNKIGISRLTKRFVKNKNDVAREKAMLNSIVEHRLYGIGEIERSLIGNLSANKVARTINAWSSSVMLGFNYFAAVPNLLMGTAMNLAEAVGGNQYTTSDFSKANKTYWSDFPNFMKDVGKSNPSSLTGLLLDHFEVLTSGHPMDTKFIDDGKFRSMMKRDSIFFLSHGVEHYIQSSMMYAVLNNMQYEGKPLLSYMEVENGTLKFNKGLKDGIPSDLIFKAREKIKHVVAESHGQYDARMKSNFQREWYGSTALMFRKWLVRGTLRRWRGISNINSDFADFESKNHHQNFYSQATGQFEEGNYVTFLRMFWSVFGKDFKEYKGNVFKKWNRMTSYEQSNVRKTTFELAMFGTMIVAQMILSNMAEDEPDEETKELYYMYAYWFRRTQSELAFWTNPKEGLKILSTPAASLAFVERIFNFGEQLMLLEKYERKTGAYKAGDYKLGKKAEDLVPLYSQIFRYNNAEDSFSFINR